MGNISVSLPSDGDTIDVADYNTPITTIVNEFNGSIDNSNISATAAIAGSKLADGGVTNAKLASGAGEAGGAWTTWTPTFTNLSGGTLNYSKYSQVGKTVFYKLKYTLAGAGVSGRITFSTPVTMATMTAGEMLSGIATFYDTSAPDEKIGITEYVSTTTIRLTASTADTSYTGLSLATGSSATVPFTWATGDIIVVNGMFEAA